MSRSARAAFALAWGFFTGICSAFAQPAASAPPLVWRFQAASPVSAPPAVASSGNVYLASVEGVVHALAADGQLRWSHGVAGMPIGEPSLDPSERAYLATSATLYSFHSDGRLRWRHQSRARIRSGAIWLAPGRVLYLGGEQRLYALSSWGDPATRVLGSAVGLFPSSGALSAVAAGKRGPELWRWSGAGRVRKSPLPRAAAGELQLLSAAERVWLLQAGTLQALEPGDSQAVAWAVPARQAAVSADGKLLLVDAGSELRWLSASSGETLYHAPLPEAVSAAPALGNDGVALVPLVSGELLLASPGSGELARVRVGSAPLLRPIWSEATGRATATAGDGALVALQLRGWSVLEQQREPGAAAVAHTLEAQRP